MRLIILTLVVCAVAGVFAAVPPTHSRSAYWQTICYLGKYGQPGGCVQVWIPAPWGPA